MNEDRLKVLELLLQENITAFKDAIKKGRVIHPKKLQYESPAVLRYLLYIQNIKDLEERIKHFKIKILLDE